MDVTRLRHIDRMATSFTYTIDDTEILKRSAESILQDVVSSVTKDLTKEFIEKQGKTILDSVNLKELQDKLTQKLEARLEDAKLQLTTVTESFNLKLLCECGHLSQEHQEQQRTFNLSVGVSASLGICHSCAKAGTVGPYLHEFVPMDNLKFIDYYKQKEKEIIYASFIS